MISKLSEYIVSTIQWTIITFYTMLSEVQDLVGFNSAPAWDPQQGFQAVAYCDHELSNQQSLISDGI